MKTGKMHERRTQLLQKHYVLSAKVRSAKFLHNKSCEVFFLHVSLLVFLLLHSLLQTRDREKGTIKHEDKKNQTVMFRVFSLKTQTTRKMQWHGK